MTQHLSVSALIRILVAGALALAPASVAGVAPVSAPRPVPERAVVDATGRVPATTPKAAPVRRARRTAGEALPRVYRADQALPAGERPALPDIALRPGRHDTAILNRQSLGRTQIQAAPHATAFEDKISFAVRRHYLSPTCKR